MAVVWTLLSEKKREKISFDQLLALPQEPSNTASFRYVDPTDQSQLDDMIASIRATPEERHLLLHKLSDFIKEDHHHQTVMPRTSLKDLIAKVKDALVPVKDQVRVVNPLEALEILSDRCLTCNLLKERIGSIRLPVTVQIEDWKQQDSHDSGTSLIWKPREACGEPGSHDMILFPPSYPITQHQDLPHGSAGILQSFIPHHGTLYKVYVIGEQVQVDLRPSLRLADLLTQSKRVPVRFDSDTVRGLVPLTQAEREAALERLALPHVKVALQETCRQLGKVLDLRLFGWDMIIDESDGLQPYIIDVNFFPKFEGFPNFHKHLLDFLLLLH